MRTRFLFPLAFLLFHLPTFAQQDKKVSDALYRLSREAANLWQTAPNLFARETVAQKALVQGRTKMKMTLGAAAIGKAAPKFDNREIISFYALGGFKGSPEALHEFREVISIDGKAVGDEKGEQASFAQKLASPDNSVKKELVSEYEKSCLGGAATDFGQILLLFTSANLKKYTFTPGGDTRIGADNAWQIAFEQIAGNESLHISEGRQKMTEKLTGEVWVRQGDYLPLRILLNSSHARNKNQIRDEAKVDYTVASGALVPASLTYRRFVNDDMVFESIHRYSDWQALPKR